MNKQEISYALAKQVPDMSRGFSIHTNYGAITIEPGWMAERIAHHVRRILEAELVSQQGQDAAKTPAADIICISFSGQEAVDWFDDYVAGKLEERAAKPLPGAVLDSISHGVHQSLAPALAPVPHAPLASPAPAVPGQCGATHQQAVAASPAQPGAGGVPAAPTGCDLPTSPWPAPGLWGSAGLGDSCSAPEVN